MPKKPGKSVAFSTERSLRPFGQPVGLRAEIAAITRAHRETLLKAALMGDGAILLDAAKLLCEAVASWAEKRPSDAKRLARKLPAWPCLYGRHIAIRENTKDALDELELAEGHILARVLASRKRKPIDLRIPANRLAAMIYEEMHESRRTFLDDLQECVVCRCVMPQWRMDAEVLEPLSKENAEWWFEIAWNGCLESRILPRMLGNDGKPIGFYRRAHNYTGSMVSG